MIIDLLIMTVLILLNALFVAGEFAAVAVPHSRLEALVQNGHAAARRLWPILQDTQRFDDYVAACQVGITLSSLILGAFGQQKLSLWLGPVLDPLPASHLFLGPGILILLTGFQMLLGELLPKSISLQFPLKAALWTTFPIVFSLWLLRFPIWILNGSGNGLLRLLGFQPEAHRHIYSSDEIALMLSESEALGEIDAGERERMQKALHLAQWHVRDLMVPRSYLKTLDLSAALKQNLRKIARSPFSLLPVYREDPEQVVGYIRCPEVLRYQLIHGDVRQLDSFVHELLVIPRNLPVKRAVDKFREHRTRVALVANEYGGVAGLLTLRDILDELTGSAGDEFVRGRNDFLVLSDGRVRVSGQMRLDQLRQIEVLAELQWDSEFLTTVNAYLLEQLDNQLPHRGQRIALEQENGLQVDVEIERISTSNIESVLICLEPRP